jgi:glutamine amidotransferase
MLGILNYGVGNPRAVVRMCESVGVPAIEVEDPLGIFELKSLILPGVGHFDACVSALHQRGFFNPVQDYCAQEAGSILGICVGAQVLGRSSSEGTHPGLGILPMTTEKLECKRLPIPHMGWSRTTWRDVAGTIGKRDSRYYFSHSFGLVPDANEYVLAEYEYESNRVAAVAHGKVLGVQFHPEKSHVFGKLFFRWFMEWTK